jgi:P-type Ca2+ transporter type 2C
MAAATWHNLPAHSALAALSSVDTGLTDEDAAARLAHYGPNVLRLTKPTPAWKILLNQFRSLVVLLLVAATAVAWLLGDRVEAAAILAVLAINAALGFVTEYRARGAMAALLRLETPRATVLRGGRRQELDAHRLVPGDVVVIEAGQSIPADARLLTAAELRTSEALLTGESLPVSKHADAVLATDTTLAERTNTIYMSTSVAAGSGTAVVFATGMDTEVGRIGGLVSGIREERTPLEQRLDALGRRLIWLTLLVTAVVVAIGVWRGEPIGLMIETGLALAIAAVPEGLPAVATIALAVGVARMARRNALVRRLPAVESLGSATTVCTDKTGTLTGGEMTVTAYYVAGHEYQVSGVGYQPHGEFTRNGEPVDAKSDPALMLALRIGALANRASLDDDGVGEGDESAGDVGAGRVRGDPTEAALLVAALKAGVDRAELAEHWPETGQIPFSSERMLMATFHDSAAGAVVHVKGAPTRVLETCSRVLTSHGEVGLDNAARDEVLRHNARLAANGLRVLALAHGRADTADNGALHDLTFVGLAGMSDPPAPGVRETLDVFRSAGIRTIMITGDQRLTAEAIARELGILSVGDEVLDGHHLRQLSIDELGRRMASVSALSRTGPEDKLRIVSALQHGGEIVAMLGDGVNDAAALKKADIGVAMGGRGTDVAREAAALILTDDRFPTIAAAVEEGRVIYDNIRKFVFYLFSCNLAEVIVILGATLAGLPQPLLPLQILWLNLVTDTFPALSLAMEPGERSVMKRPPTDPAEAILSRRFVGRVALYAVLIAVVSLVAHAWSVADASPRAGTITFMTLALAQLFHLGNARHSMPVLSRQRMTANPWAIAAVVLVVVLQLAAVYSPTLAGLLVLQPLGMRDWLLIVPLAILPAVVGQGRALIMERGRRNARRGHK